MDEKAIEIIQEITLPELNTGDLFCHETSYDKTDVHVDESEKNDDKNVECLENEKGFLMSNFFQAKAEMDKNVVEQISQIDGNLRVPSTLEEDLKPCTLSEEANDNAAGPEDKDECKTSHDTWFSNRPITPRKHAYEESETSLENSLTRSVDSMLLDNVKNGEGNFGTYIIGLGCKYKPSALQDDEPDKKEEIMEESDTAFPKKACSTLTKDMINEIRTSTHNEHSYNNENSTIYFDHLVYNAIQENGPSGTTCVEPTINAPFLKVQNEDGILGEDKALFDYREGDILPFETYLHDEIQPPHEANKHNYSYSDYLHDNAVGTYSHNSALPHPICENYADTRNQYVMSGLNLNYCAGDGFEGLQSNENDEKMDLGADDSTHIKDDEIKKEKTYTFSQHSQPVFGNDYLRLKWAGDGLDSNCLPISLKYEEYFPSSGTLRDCNIDCKDSLMEHSLSPEQSVSCIPEPSASEVSSAFQSPSAYQHNHKSFQWDMRSKPNRIRYTKSYLLKYENCALSFVFPEDLRPFTKTGELPLKQMPDLPEVHSPLFLGKPSPSMGHIYFYKYLQYSSKKRTPKSQLKN